MIDPATGGILRPLWQFANSTLPVVLIAAGMIASSPLARGQRTVVDPATEMTSFVWDLGRQDDPNFRKFPEHWKRFRGIGYPSYVRGEIAARDPDLEKTLVGWDTQIARLWKLTRTQLQSAGDSLDRRLPTLPATVQLRTATTMLPSLMPSIADMLVDRYLRIDLDGGQFAAQSPLLPASRRFQYRFSCQVMTRGLKHDTALAQFEFLNDEGEVIETHSTAPMSGTQDWTTLTIPAVQPPFSATKMQVRLRVLHSDDGLEDIRGSIGFDNIRIDQHPQLAVATDRPLGVYQNGQAVIASARIMGLPKGESSIQFVLYGSTGEQMSTATRRVEIEPSDTNQSERNASAPESLGTAVSWELPPLGPGFYRISAFVEGSRISTLASETTVAVVDRLVSGPPHGCFGWSLPTGRVEVPPRELAAWLAEFGVAWVKYPCWLAAEDVDSAEETAIIFSRLQDEGIETIGILDSPPEDQQAFYELRGRRDLVAAQLFRNRSTWQPLLEPVMTRMTLKVRRWQLGADRDHSFLGRPRLNESIKQISSGLQGYGQPIDVAISWPWEEAPSQGGRSSWQAECRSTNPPLGAQELDAYLSLRSLDNRPGAPKTWLLIDPISSKRYDQSARIQDLVLRMATVRSHRVQAAFVSDPHDPKHGLLRRDGRPGELLLPWRTTSRLIGNLRRAGSLQLRNGTDNIVFAGNERAVLMLWSPAPGEERLYLGDDAEMIDVWGRVSDLPIQYDGNQPLQVIETGPKPVFVVGADPSLLAFRMSVRVEPPRLDSLIGQEQRLNVSLTNPLDESLVGDLQIAAPESWTVQDQKQHWQVLANRAASYPFKVSLTNTAMIGEYEVPLHFELDTIPPKRIIVYRRVTVGPEGIDIDTKTRLLNRDELQVQIELTNRTSQPKTFDCLLFPPPGRQFQDGVITVAPGATVRRDFFWPDAKSFLGKQMTMRAVEQDGPRVINYRFKIRG
jgi:hypothetical protein